MFLSISAISYFALSKIWSAIQLHDSGTNKIIHKGWGFVMDTVPKNLNFGKSRELRLLPQVTAALTLVFSLASSHGVQAQNPLQVTRVSTIYESAYWGNQVETFSSRGMNSARSRP